MNRRKFLGNFLALSVGISSNLIIPWTIKNYTIYREDELKEKILVSPSVYELEKRVAFDSIMLQNNPETMISWRDKLMREAKLEEQINSIEKDIIQFYLENIKRFLSNKKQDKKEIKELNKSLEQAYKEVILLKDKEKIDVVNQKRNIFIALLGFQQPYDPKLVEEYSKFDEFGRFVDIHLRNNYNKTFYEIYKTLVNIAPDALFIKRVSEIKGIPIDDIVAHIHLESRGKKFMIGSSLEINRFQILIESLNNFYRYAIKQDDEVADYVLKNTSPSTLLEDVISNPNLNAALAISNMEYLRKIIPTYEQSVLAYNMSLKRVLEFSKSFIRRLKHLEETNPDYMPSNRLDKWEEKAFRYYKHFFEAKNYFKELRSYLTQLT